LVRFLWKQDYDPRTHDNRLYVTIKRLRDLIEPDPRHPRYIIKRDDGYCLNENAQVVTVRSMGDV
jgi:DNA-binding response OmpR family regulator